MSVVANRKIVDSRGSFCPGPITDLFKAFRAANIGDEIELWATDPAARADVTAWANRSGNQIIEMGQDGDHLKVVIKIVKKGR